ncbi:unnamed protein product [Eruca vesicaria subsp. sativa]|uniref:Uncharacterized protein n=1 Tax=Eruca vesicaria subsp. sativa TaxID=29727 RepID=A0ABC8IZY3_ERUVS|nr:unnamed protein product [Eruca vesicaria subsp. sativa]
MRAAGPTYEIQFVNPSHTTVKQKSLEFLDALQTFYDLKTNLQLIMYSLSPAGPTETKRNIPNV